MSIDAETLKLTNALFVSYLAINLISVSQLNSKEISVVFDAENASITFMFKNNVFAHVNKIFNQFLWQNEVYTLMNLHTETKKTHASSLIKKSMNIQIWHRRFVHAFYQRTIENKKNVIDLFYHENISKELCEACLKKNKKHLYFAFLWERLRNSQIELMLTSIKISQSHFATTNIFLWLKTMRSICSSSIW